MERASERRSAARTAVVWEAVQHLLVSRSPADQASDPAAVSAASDAAEVLDVGGGTGGFAVRLAGLGHRVTVVDPSPDALAALAQRAAEAGVADRVHGIQGDLASLPGLVPSAGADLVLCHGVLGLLDDPVRGLATLGSVLRPGGSLSVVVAQAHAAVLARAMAGAFTDARALLEQTATSVLPAAGRASGTPSGERRFTPVQVRELLVEAGLEVQRLQGVRVFTDLVPGSLLDSQPGATRALLDLERMAADRAELLTLAAQLHVVASRPD